jgi:hypothetical protein
MGCDEQRVTLRADRQWLRPAVRSQSDTVRAEPLDRALADEVMVTCTGGVSRSLPRWRPRSNKPRSMRHAYGTLGKQGFHGQHQALDDQPAPPVLQNRDHLGLLWHSLLPQDQPQPVTEHGEAVDGGVAWLQRPRRASWHWSSPMSVPASCCHSGSHTAWRPTSMRECLLENTAGLGDAAGDRTFISACDNATDGALLSPPDRGSQGEIIPERLLPSKT